MMIERLDTSADIFLGDAGFDSNDIYRACFVKGIRPIVKQRKYGNRRGRLRKRAGEEFDLDIHRRYMGVIEGVFGGLENKGLLFTRYTPDIERRA